MNPVSGEHSNVSHSERSADHSIASLSTIRKCYACLAALQSFEPSIFSATMRTDHSASSPDGAPPIVGSVIAKSSRRRNVSDIIGLVDSLLYGALLLRRSEYLRTSWTGSLRERTSSIIAANWKTA